MTIKASAPDQFNDPSFKVLYERIQEWPEYAPLVKEASLDEDEWLGLPNSAFAWQERRRFPVHTKEHTALSYLYATKTGSAVPEDVMTTIKDAVAAYGIELPAVSTTKVAASAVPEDEYIFPELQRWRVNSVETAKLAEEQLLLQPSFTGLPLDAKVTAAARLVKQADRLGIKVASDTLSLAGYLACDYETLHAALQPRYRAAERAGAETVKQAYAAVEKNIPEHGVCEDREALLKLAYAIDALDEESNYKQSPRYVSATRSVFNTSAQELGRSTKVASAQVDLGGRQVGVDKLAALPLSMYEDVFGKEVVPEITTGGRLDSEKIAAVISTMPLDLKRVFVRQAGPYIR